jgi:curved DNA-binding protein CbpA
VTKESEWYKVLGISESATEAEITRAYRKLAKELHPDRDASSEARFKEVTKAYEILRDSDRRAKHDKNLDAERKEERRIAEARERKERIEREKKERKPSDAEVKEYGERIRDGSLGGSEPPKSWPPPYTAPETPPWEGGQPPPTTPPRFYPPSGSGPPASGAPPWQSPRRPEQPLPTAHYAQLWSNAKVDALAILAVLVGIGALIAVAALIISSASGHKTRSAEISGPYSVHVDYGQSLSNMITAGNLNQSEAHITERGRVS